mmetsp:Transcript_4649/g.10775  ORF Transcript_4649/g.10775 Transcript_4649/m.10775 type:complete len:237 (+) Transcript_4649:639-1349(+)
MSLQSEPAIPREAKLSLAVHGQGDRILPNLQEVLPFNDHLAVSMAIAIASPEVQRVPIKLLLLPVHGHDHTDLRSLRDPCSGLLKGIVSEGPRRPRHQSSKLFLPHPAAALEHHYVTLLEPPGQIELRGRKAGSGARNPHLHEDLCAHLKARVRPQVAGPSECGRVEVGVPLHDKEASGTDCRHQIEEAVAGQTVHVTGHGLAVWITEKSSSLEALLRGNRVAEPPERGNRAAVAS